MALELLIFFALFFMAAFFWPTWRLWQRERVKALVLTYDDTAHGLVAKWFRATLIGIFVMLAALLSGVPASATGPLQWIEGDITRSTGWALLVGSLVWVIAAQAQMGSSWRIGIDGGTRPPLVTTGLFAISRNPIFLGMRVSLLGLFLVLPNALSLAILAAGEILIQVQVRLEEQHLSTVHDAEFQRYRASVRRWL